MAWKNGTRCIMISRRRLLMVRTVDYEVLQSKSVIRSGLVLMNVDNRMGHAMKKTPLACHAERQRSIHVGRAARLVRADASLPLSMTRAGAFFTACCRDRFK